MAVPLLDLRAQYQSIKDEIDTAVAAVFEQQSFVLGPAVEALEMATVDYLGVKHAVGVSSGSDALLMSLMAAGVEPGDEVLVPGFTFFASASCVSRLGARPVFCDIEQKSYNIDLNGSAGKITDRTRAIIPVDLYGQCADLEGVLDLARQHDLAVVEDAAQAFGADRNGRKAGTFGHFGCFSFYPTKNLGGAGDGGMVTTNDDALADRIRLLRLHGERPRYHNKVVGICGRLDSLQAAVVGVKLRHLDRWNARRIEIAGRYNELFAPDARVTTPTVCEGNSHIYHQYTIRVPDRDGVMQRLIERSIGCAIHYPIPVHLQECYRELGGKQGDLPNAEKAASEVLSLPCYPELTDAQVEEVAAGVLASLPESG